MQNTFICLYIFTYLTTIFFIFFFINKNSQKINLVITSFNNFFIYIHKYTNCYNYLMLLLFCTTGLPPVFIFFIKLNLVMSFMFYNWYFSIFFIFSFLFSSVIFYVQLFKLKSLIKIKLTLHNRVYKNSWYLTNNIFIGWHLLFNIFLIIIYLPFIFFTDFFLLIFNLIN